MEKRLLKISYSLSGAGSITTRMFVPKSMLDKMGVTKDEREVEVEYNDSTKEIIIRKKQ